ncbi:MAG TPA: hypothetical protein VGK00_01690 [Anaerolineales bacterium]|jgi:hypothetical protein
MEVTGNLVTKEEKLIFENARIRLAEWLVDFIHCNVNNDVVLREERDLIIQTKKLWWNQRLWDSFLYLSQIKVKGFMFDEVINLFVVDLINAQKSGELSKLAQAYCEFAKDQYYDGNESFYIELGLDRFEEIWKLFHDAIRIEPNNIVLRYHLIGMMQQSNAGNTQQLLNEIHEMLSIQPTENQNLSSEDFGKCRDLAVTLLRKYQLTGHAFLQDDLNAISND